MGSAEVEGSEKAGLKQLKGIGRGKDGDRKRVPVSKCVMHQQFGETVN